jgi:two-component system sensor histidine kinase MprB
VGLAGADQGRIFDRFYRAEAACTLPGSGLGLSIPQQIVDIRLSALKRGGVSADR